MDLVYAKSSLQARFIAPKLVVADEKRQRLSRRDFDGSFRPIRHENLESSFKDCLEQQGRRRIIFE